jgi:hypothetical protein
MGYDPTSGQLVLFGGESGTTSWGGTVHGVESLLAHCCEKYAVTVAVPFAAALTVATN